MSDDVKRKSIFWPIQAVFRGLFARRDLEEKLPPLWKRLLIFALALPFFGYYVGSFVFQTGETHLNYPFSSMAFYSENRDVPPYDQPKYFPVYRGFLEIGRSMDPESEAYDFAYIPSDVAEPLRLKVASEEAMRIEHDRIRLRYAEGTNWDLLDGGNVEIGANGGVGWIKTYAQLAAVPPSTEPAFPMAVMQNGLLAVEDSRSFRGVGASLEWDEERDQYVIKTAPWGWEDPTFTVLARRNLREERKMTEQFPLDGTWEGPNFYIKNLKDIDGSFLYTLVRVEDPVLGVEEELYSGPENFQGYR